MSGHKRALSTQTLRNGETMAHKNAKKSLLPAAFETLSDNDLNKVVGGSKSKGKASLQDLTIRKSVDVSSPSLF
jgi:bacteriocin-like protein